ncbi:MAG: hypothetical protein HY236_16630 [Acidobacteria bacterium]|nr:hypothetical protein [Acidobacteriota bacterium]
MESTTDLPRRRFLQGSALGAVAALSLQGRAPRRILIEAAREPNVRRRLAERELLRGLGHLRLGAEARLAGSKAEARSDDLWIGLRLEPEKFGNPEAYSIAAEPGGVTLSAAGEQALLYAVFDFLERQGAFFGIDGESYPLEPARGLVLPPPNRPWNGTPRFAVRGLLPWPDFLNCITVYNEEDFRAYFESMLRMRFNTFGVHVYSGANQWAESYLSFEFAGVGHLAFLDTTATNRWGYLPQRTSRFTMGAAQFYDGEVFGADAMRRARDPWEEAERTRQLWRDAFAYAQRLGIRTGVGFEPYQIPDEIWRALPPEAKPAQIPGPGAGARFDVESVTARDLLEARLGQLLAAYPDIDYVWLWEDEGMNWASQKSGAPLSVTPFLQAHDFLRRHAPGKHLVVSGWGGVARHFESFHKRLPMDIIFTCLSDNLGWDPVHEVFGKLEGRERWPIPWLEDDPAMWLPQFHVHRFESDMNRAAAFGCQGLLGIHWRHRIVDPTAGFQARCSWEDRPSPADYFPAYARTQAAGERAARLANVLADADRDRKLLCTFTGEFKDGHAQTHEFSGDYGEAFAFWNKYAPESAVAESQKQVATELRRLANATQSVAERERVEYLAGHVEFLVPYTEAWTLAHRLHGVLEAAGELKKSGRGDEAREKVRKDGIPLWLRLAPEVRRAMLIFQRIVATRNDQGALASMHDKFVRLALVRLRLSMKEYLGELPPETEKLFGQVTQPDTEAPQRLIVPTRPSMLAPGEKVRVLIIAPGPAEVDRVSLHTRRRGSDHWQSTPARLLGRRTYEATLGPLGPGSELLDYYVSANGEKLVAPADAPRAGYIITIT